ncbi:MAG: T9SS type A sorting domain-containing protein, partial [Chitinophagales bacterium]
DYVTPTETVALLFVASDSTLSDVYLEGQSTVEAAVDDVQLWGANLASGIHELYANDFITAIYPNPAHDLFTIQLNTPLYSAAEIKIYNALGTQVKSVTGSSSNNLLSVDVQHLPAGIYTVAVYANGIYANSPLVIQKR